MQYIEYYTDLGDRSFKAGIGMKDTCSCVCMCVCHEKCCPGLKCESSHSPT